jgi:hypothetical protein
MILALLLLAVDPATYVGNVYGTVTDSASVAVADALVTVGAWHARTDHSGQFLINSISTPYDGRDYIITVNGSTIDTVRVLPGAAMALELNVRLGGNTEWHYRHERLGVRSLATAFEDGGKPPYSKAIFATREGLVGGTTANGHVIVPNDHFAALPSRRALSTNFGNERQVRVSYRGRTVVVPVWDIGPWNIHDDYWNPSIIRESFKDLPRGKPEAQAAFLEGYNGGLDERGRVVRTPAGIDLADGTFLIDLGLTNNDYVEVEYLWLDDEGPIVSDIVAFPGTFSARVTDASPIEKAEFFIDTMGEPGTGSSAIVIGDIVTAPSPSLAAGTTHLIAVRARDVYENWGPLTSATITIAPQSPKRRAVRR